MTKERSEMIEEGERPIPSRTRQLGDDRLLLLLLAIAEEAGYLVGLGLIAIIGRDIGAF